MSNCQRVWSDTSAMTLDQYRTGPQQCLVGTTRPFGCWLHNLNLGFSMFLLHVSTSLFNALTTLCPAFRPPNKVAMISRLPWPNIGGC